MKLNLAKKELIYIWGAMYSVLFALLIVLMGRFALKTFLWVLAVSMPIFLFLTNQMVEDIVIGMKQIPVWLNRIIMSLFFILPSFISFAFDANKVEFFNDTDIRLDFDRVLWIGAIVVTMLMYKAYIVGCWVYTAWLRQKGRLKD
ncbi:MAG: hypothetical protein JXR56_02870 [Candidatus Cloacimonetes bacterium]|nr:hypothetical protein [Candidatus Cloacimonadota bacterium]